MPRFLGMMLLLILSASTATAAHRKIKTIPDSESQSIITQIIDSVVEIPDSLSLGEYALNFWKMRVEHRDIDINDKNIRWPGFVDFCLRTYRWAERVFNTYDTTYVKDSGPPGKAIIHSDNWHDAYRFVPTKIPEMLLAGEFYSNIGLQLKYGILSVGYSYDISTTLNSKTAKHTKLNLSLTCARFILEANLWRSNGTIFVRKFGEYNDGHLIRLPFNGLDFSAFDLHGLYFFNYSKFSLGATYGYSGDQRRSAGTWMLGPSIYRYRADFDFSKLPAELLESYPFPINEYRFDFISYNLSAGYSFNWVLNKHFTFNATVCPGIGVTVTHQKDTYGKRTIPSYGARGKFAILYNNKRFFCCVKGNLTGNFYHTHDIRFFSHLRNYQAAVGIRF